MPLPKIQYRTGVYCWRNKVNGKVYVGGAYQDFDHRKAIHVRDLRAGRHNNQHLQAAWNKYGERNFEFLILETHKVEGLKERETCWIAKLDATNRLYGYNKSPTGGSPLGTKHSVEARANFSAAMSRRMQDPNEREKVGRAMRGKHHGAGAKERLRDSTTNLWKNAEHRAKVIAANTGLKRTDEVKAKMSKAMTGKKRTEEQRRKMSELAKKRKPCQKAIEAMRMANYGRKKSPEEISKIRAAHLGRGVSEESRKRMSEGQKRRFQRPEERAKNKLINLGRVLTEKHKAKISASQLRPETVSKKSVAAKAQWERVRASQGASYDSSRKSQEGSEEANHPQDPSLAGTLFGWT